MKNKQTAGDDGLRLLKKGQKGLASVLFSRMALIILLLLLQIFLIFAVFNWLSQSIPFIWTIYSILTALMVLYLINSPMDPTSRISWLILVMLFPVAGALFFWFTQSDFGHRLVKARIAELEKETLTSIPQNPDTMQSLNDKRPGKAALAQYAARNSCHPVYTNTEVTYFPSGEEKWKKMLEELEKAERFIYLEYFIVEEGLMWGKILEILARKAKQGVDVRLMYDGTCEFTTLSHDYPKRIQELGIKCKMFSPVIPFVSTHYNYRDHRKILVIDGHTAFNGGVNLADEYINHIDKHGHWKDTALMLKGEAVQSFTLMFLKMWNIVDPDPQFKEEIIKLPAGKEKASSGFVLPYGDCPLDDDLVGEKIYMDILNRAERYVHIMTPYLILDSELEGALKYAAERGVDVKLILPGIPDKKIPYALAKSHYNSLLQSGVQIYEYTPGFVHAKVFVCDDKEAVVGTINLDYRSLYHHFECATWMYETEVISEIEDDFQKTLASCTQITPNSIWQGYEKLKLAGILAKVLAPLM